jgi:VWFA-related protein
MLQPKDLTRREILAGAASIFAGSLFSRAQESPKFSVNVDVVNVFVTVRDKKGNIIKDLTQEEFAISEDGRAQTIRYFSRESDLPLTVGLIVDTTPSEAGMLEEEREASRIFLNKILRPDKDSAFLVQYANGVELLQDLTSSREELERGLRLLRQHSLMPGQTVLANAIYLTSNEIMKSQEGRKALILLGDGGHVGNRREEAITAAHMADTLIYGILIYDKNFGGFGGGGGWPPRGGPGFGWPGGGSYDRTEDKENLKIISTKTGGAYFEVTKKAPLEQIYARIEEDLRSQYNLGYTPDVKAQNGYRTIKVNVNRKGMVVHSREGYYPTAIKGPQLRPRKERRNAKDE